MGKPDQKFRMWMSKERRGPLLPLHLYGKKGGDHIFHKGSVEDSFFTEHDRVYLHLSQKARGNSTLPGTGEARRRGSQPNIEEKVERRDFVYIRSGGMEERGHAAVLKRVQAVISSRKKKRGR